MELNLFRLGYVTRHHYIDKLWKVFKSNKNRQALELMCVLTLYNHSSVTLPASTVVYCMLDLLDLTAKSCKLVGIEHLIEDNGEFEAAKDYLNLKVLHVHTIEKCTIMLLKTVCKARDTPGSGLLKAFTANFDLVAQIAKANIH
jgi:hypothetical protein